LDKYGERRETFSLSFTKIQKKKNKILARSVGDRPLQENGYLVAATFPQ
jgi:hypothetical protein